MLAFTPMPFVDRGAGPVHLGPMLLVASRLAPDLVLLVDEGHLAVTELPYGEKIDVGGVVFPVPTRARLDALPRRTIPAHIGADLRRRHDGALNLMRSLLTEVDTALADWYHAELVGLAAQGLQAVVAWCNLPSLEEAAQRCGLPVIHVEVGPLRPPFFMASMYFDFVGVNGRTGAVAEVARYVQGDSVVDWTGDRWCWAADRPALEAATATAVTHVMGLALQVESDSNTVAFSCGVDATALIYRAWASGGSECRLLVRDHPSAHFSLRGFPFTDIDDSAHSLAFVGRCQAVHTVNSSVAFEAEFVGREAVVYGDSPLRVIMGVQKQRDVLRSALFFAYLTPASLALDADYIAWRLGQPAAAEIARMHRDHLRLLQPTRGRTLATAPPRHIAARAAASGFDSKLVASQWLTSTSIQRKLLLASEELARLREAGPSPTGSVGQPPSDGGWLELQRAAGEQRAQQAEARLAEQAALLERLREGNESLQQQRAAWDTQAADRQAVIEAMRVKEIELIEVLEKTREGAGWLEQQRAAWEQRALASESSQTEQEALLQQMRDGNARLAQDCAAWERAAGDKALALAHSLQSVAALRTEQAKAEHRQREAENAASGVREAFDGLRGDHAALKARAQSLDQVLLERDRELARLENCQRELQAAVAWTESRRAQLAAELALGRQQLQDLQDAFDAARRDGSARHAELEAQLVASLQLIHSLTPAPTMLGRWAVRVTRLSQRLGGSKPGR